MTVCKFATADASFERSPGQDGDVFAGNVIDQRQPSGDTRNNPFSRAWFAIPGARAGAPNP